MQSNVDADIHKEVLHSIGLSQLVTELSDGLFLAVCFQVLIKRFLSFHHELQVDLRLHIEWGRIKSDLSKLHILATQLGP